MIECKCDRCEDPTEFGTFFGGIVCDKCSHLGIDGDGETVGVLYEKDDSWICNHCHATLDLESGRKKLFTLNMNIESAISDSKGSVQIMELVKWHKTFI